MNMPTATSMPYNTPGLDPESLTSQVKNGGEQSIDKVANGFESVFASLMLKEMRKTLDSGSMFAGDSGDVYGGLFDLYIGQHMAQNGGLGIAAAVKRQLEGASYHTSVKSGDKHGK
jgi:Rod binding domain-containing protein